MVPTESIYLDLMFYALFVALGAGFIRDCT